MIRKSVIETSKKIIKNEVRSLKELSEEHKYRHKYE